MTSTAATRSARILKGTSGGVPCSPSKRVATLRTPTCDQVASANIILKVEDSTAPGVWTSRRNDSAGIRASTASQSCSINSSNSVIIPSRAVDTDPDSVRPDGVLPVGPVDWATIMTRADACAAHNAAAAPPVGAIPLARA